MCWFVCVCVALASFYVYVVRVRCIGFVNLMVVGEMVVVVVLLNVFVIFSYAARGQRRRSSSTTTRRGGCWLDLSALVVCVLCDLHMFTNVTLLALLVVVRVCVWCMFNENVVRM